jgi:UDP-N-acetylglucosamine acyltransferase
MWGTVMAFDFEFETAKISPLAQIHPDAQIAPDVSIGPYALIGPDVRIGRGTRITHNATIIGNTTLGENNQVFPGAVLGAAPQDLKYQGGKTRLVIGNGNIFRECVTINTGTEKGGGITRIGSNNFFMACSHVAHDCLIEDGVVVANAVLFAGHIKVEEFAYISGGSAFHHYTTIGRLAFVGGLSRVTQDVPPFTIVEGNPAEVRGINVVGLRRRNLSEESIEALKKVFRLIYRSGTTRAAALQKLDETPAPLLPEVKYLLEFLHRIDQGKHGRSREALRAE